MPILAGHKEALATLFLATQEDLATYMRLTGVRLLLAGDRIVLGGMVCKLGPNTATPLGAVVHDGTGCPNGLARGCRMVPLALIQILLRQPCAMRSAMVIKTSALRCQVQGPVQIMGAATIGPIWPFIRTLPLAGTQK